MSLLTDSMTECVFIEKHRVADGEGGYTTEYIERETFLCAIAFNNSIETRIAEKQGVTSLYTVTTEKGVNLEFHELFKRLKDNKVFRVTSDFDDKQTPITASFSYESVTAEEFVL